MDSIINDAIKLDSIHQTKLRNAITATAAAGTIFALASNRNSKRLMITAVLLSFFAAMLSVMSMIDYNTLGKMYPDEINYLGTYNIWISMPALLLFIQFGIVGSLIVTLSKIFIKK